MKKTMTSEDKKKKKEMLKNRRIQTHLRRKQLEEEKRWNVLDNRWHTTASMGAADSEGDLVMNRNHIQKRRSYQIQFPIICGMVSFWALSLITKVQHVTCASTDPQLSSCSKVLSSCSKVLRSEEKNSGRKNIPGTHFHERGGIESVTIMRDHRVRMSHSPPLLSPPHAHPRSWPERHATCPMQHVFKRPSEVGPLTNLKN